MRPSDYQKPEAGRRFYGTVDACGDFVVYAPLAYSADYPNVATCPTREHAQMIADALERTADEEDANAARAMLERRAWEEVLQLKKEVQERLDNELAALEQRKESMP